MAVARAAARERDRAPIPTGQILRSARDGLGLSRYQVSRALDVREDTIRFLEADQWAMSPALSAYVEFLRKQMGDEWLLNSIAALESRFAERQQRALTVDRFVMADRALRAQEGRKVQRRSKQDAPRVDLAQMASESPARLAKRPRSSGDRAAVHAPGLQSVAERVLAAWGMKPRTLEGMAA